MSPVESYPATIYRARCDGCWALLTDDEGRFEWLNECDLRSWLDQSWDWLKLADGRLICARCRVVCEECGEDFPGTREQATAVGWAESVDKQFIVCPGCQEGPDWLPEHERPS
jgi:hypothetical protein